MNRYEQAHVQTLNTADCGGIRIKTDMQGVFHVETARKSRKAIWRWPVGTKCTFERSTMAQASLSTGRPRSHLLRREGG